VAFRKSRQWAHQVHVHVREATCRYQNGVERCCWLLVDLPTLAVLAVTAHGSHVPANSLPHEAPRNHPACGTNPRVGHVVYRVEDSTPVHLRYQGPGNATCYVS